MTREELIKSLGLDEAQAASAADALKTFQQGIMKEAEDSTNQQISAIDGKNKDLLGQIKLLKDSVQEIPEGFDKDKWNELLAMQKTTEENKLKSEEKWEELKGNLNEKHSKELGAIQTREKFLVNALHSQLIDNTAIEAITEASGNIKLLIPHVKGSMKVSEKDGKFDVVVVDKNGEPRINAEKDGANFTVTDLVTEMQADESFQAAFRTGNSGGNAGGTGSGGGAPAGSNPFDKDSKHYNLTHQAVMKRENPDLAAQMQKQAEAA